MPIDEVRRQFYTLSFFLFGLLVLIALPAWIDAPERGHMEEITKLQVVEEVQPSPYDDVVLSARSAFVYDVNEEKVLFAKNERDIVPLASVTKLMTALVAHTHIPDYNQITISAEALNEEGDSGLYINETWRPYDLIGYTLLVSSNDGAHAVASVGGARLLSEKNDVSSSTPRELFVDEMNNTARSLGLEDLHFFNETGLDVGENSAGAYGSAQDIGKLLAYMTNEVPEVLEATRYDSLSYASLENLPHIATNTNIIARAIPGLIGSKTGFTDLAGGNLAITFDAGLGYPIVVVVLGSTIDERFTDTEALVWATLESLAQQ